MKEGSEEIQEESSEEIKSDTDSTHISILPDITAEQLLSMFSIGVQYVQKLVSWSKPGSSGVNIELGDEEAILGTLHSALNTSFQLQFPGSINN